MSHPYIHATRVISLVNLATVFCVGIANLALGRWQPALLELGIGGAFFVFFSVQWVRLNDLTRQRREPKSPAS